MLPSYGLSVGYNDDSTSNRLPFDCSLTALGPIDDEQETHLSLTNRATRLEVSQGHGHTLELNVPLDTV